MNLKLNNISFFILINCLLMLDIFYYLVLLLPTPLLILFLLFFALVIGIQFFCIQLFPQFQMYLATLFITSNLVIFKLINFEFINSLNNPFKFLIFIFLIIIFYRILIVTNSKSRNKVIFSLLIISLASIASITNDEKISINDSHAKRIQLPEFNQKPDVFFNWF